MLANKRTTVPVTLKALLQRINRRLGVDREVLKRARSPKVAVNVGRYFVVRGDRVARERVVPEVLARELGALSDWEHLET